MTADMSVAPEIARLAEAIVPAAAQPGAQPGAAAQLTLGTLAQRLRSIAAVPERWWGLVSFDPRRSVKIPVEASAAYQAWLVIMPPGGTGHSCDCDVATMIAGEATEGAEGAEGAAASAVLRPGPVRVHGAQRHRERHGLRGCGAGYSISLHARANRLPAKR